MTSLAANEKIFFNQILKYLASLLLLAILLASIYAHFIYLHIQILNLMHLSAGNKLWIVFLMACMAKEILIFISKKKQE
jgi:hypothetical protein